MKARTGPVRDARRIDDGALTGRTSSSLAINCGRQIVKPGRGAGGIEDPQVARPAASNSVASMSIVINSPAASSRGTSRSPRRKAGRRIVSDPAGGLIASRPPRRSGRDGRLQRVIGSAAGSSTTQCRRRLQRHPASPTDAPVAGARRPGVHAVARCARTFSRLRRIALIDRGCASHDSLCHWVEHTASWLPARRLRSSGRRTQKSRVRAVADVKLWPSR